MQAIIYAGLRNGSRDQAIHDALMYKHVAEVASQFRLSPYTVRASANRNAKAQSFYLVLLGGGSPLRIGPVVADSFRKAALGAYRNYRGTFQNLELPCWVITDGTQRIEVVELRKIDSGEATI